MELSHTSGMSVSAVHALQTQTMAQTMDRSRSVQMDQPISYKEINDKIEKIYKLIVKQLDYRIGVSDGIENELVEIYKNVSECLRLFDRLYVKEKELKLDKVNVLIGKYNQIYDIDTELGEEAQAAQTALGIRRINQVTTAPTLVDEVSPSVDLPDVIIDATILDFFKKFLVEIKRKNQKDEAIKNYFEYIDKENNILQIKINESTDVRNKVFLEIERYKKNPLSVSHPVLAAVCAGCPHLLKMFANSIDTSNESARMYTLDRTGPYESTPITMAIEMEDVEALEVLLRVGANKATALKAAVESNQMLMVMKLIAWGAQLDSSILRIARRNGNLKIINFLEKAHAKPSAPVSVSSASRSAPAPIDAYKAIRKIDIKLMSAVRLRDMKRVEKLMQKGANPTVVFSSYNPEIQDFGDTALYCAIQHWQGKRDTELVNKLQFLNKLRLTRSDYQANARDAQLHGLVLATTGLLKKEKIQGLREGVKALGIKVPQALETALQRAGY